MRSRSANMVAGKSGCQGSSRTGQRPSSWAATACQLASSSALARLTALLSLLHSGFAHGQQPRTPQGGLGQAQAGGEVCDDRALFHKHHVLGGPAGLVDGVAPPPTTIHSRRRSSVSLTGADRATSCAWAAAESTSANAMATQLAVPASQRPSPFQRRIMIGRRSPAASEGAPELAAESRLHRPCRERSGSFGGLCGGVAPLGVAAA